MTNKEAAWHLGTYSTTMGSGQTTDDQHNEAKRIAIKLLKQEPCEDCISRQAVLNIIDSYSNSQSNAGDVTQDCISDVMALSSVQPKPKTGHWINKSHRSGCGVAFIEFECSCCHKKVYDEFAVTYQYCPNCGARMSEVSE